MLYNPKEGVFEFLNIEVLSLPSLSLLKSEQGLVKTCYMCMSN